MGIEFYHRGKFVYHGVKLCRRYAAGDGGGGADPGAARPYRAFAPGYDCWRRYAAEGRLRRVAVFRSINLAGGDKKGEGARSFRSARRAGV